MNEADDALLNEVGRTLAQARAAGDQAATMAADKLWWSTTNAMTMSAIVLLFGLVVLGLCAWLLKAGKPATSVLRVFGTILVIMMTTFLVVAGYSDQQIAAPIGLLGTIAGYLLGREAGRTPERASDAAGAAPGDRVVDPAADPVAVRRE